MVFCSGKSDFSYFLKNFENASSVIYRTLEKGSNFHRLIVGESSKHLMFDTNLFDMTTLKTSLKNPWRGE